MENSIKASGFKKKEKIEVYDWLRGIASIAVILGHFKPFGLSKVYFIWAVHAFVLVTVVFVSQRLFSFEKFAKRLAYVGFIYLSLFLVFLPLFMLQGSQSTLPLSAFFLNPLTVFIENPYFAHLWYLLVYVQLLFLLFFMSKQFKQWDGRWVLLIAFVMSNVSFGLTYFVFNQFSTILLTSWFFTIAVGLYLLPQVTAWMEKNNQYRMGRCLLSLLVLSFIWSQPALQAWLILPDARMSVFSTLVYLLCIYAVMELFFILNHYSWFRFPKRFVFLVSHYTLALYIYHQGLGKLLEPYAVSMEVLTPVAIISGLLIGSLLHAVFLKLEKRTTRLQLIPHAPLTHEPATELIIRKEDLVCAE